jgi:hypothetical protein
VCVHVRGGVAAGAESNEVRYVTVEHGGGPARMTANK